MRLVRRIIAAICCVLAAPAGAEELWKGKILGLWVDGYRIEDTVDDQAVVWFRACPFFNLEDQQFDRVEARKSLSDDCPEPLGGADKPREGPFDGTLRAVNESGAIKCGVSPGVPGFAYTGPDGEWAGLNVSICRALAAAL